MFKILGVGVAVVALVAIFIFALKQHNRWVDWCHSQGGHVIDHTTSTTVTTFDSKGNPHVGVGSNTTYYCLNESGGIIDIE